MESACDLSRRLRAVLMPDAGIGPLARMVDELAMHAPIPSEDRGLLLALPCVSRVFEAGGCLVREGDAHDHCGMLVSGMACRYGTSGDGARQIVAIHVPGDVFDLPVMHPRRADHDVRALSRCEVVMVPLDALRGLAADRPSVGRAILAVASVELSMAREWMLNIGRRDARTRIAHLLCELAERLDQRSAAPVWSYELPMTQEQLGDALGLTSVHVNRMLKGLVSDGLIDYGRRGISIPDREALARVGDFDGRYLYGRIRPDRLDGRMPGIGAGLVPAGMRRTVPEGTRSSRGLEGSAE